jgi:hypothetical protein
MNFRPADHELKFQVLTAYEVEYRDLADNWRSLDGKAQGTVAIAGVFIGGAVAFAQRLSSDSSNAMRTAVGLGVLLLLVCVGFAISVLRIRTVNAPPDGDSVRKLVADLLEVSESERAGRYLGYLEDRVVAWKTGIDEVASVNDSKATALWRAQLSLAAAIGAFAILIVLQLYASI